MLGVHNIRIIIAGHDLRFTARLLTPRPCRPQIDLLILNRFLRDLLRHSFRFLSIFVSGTCAKIAQSYKSKRNGVAEKEYS